MLGRRSPSTAYDGGNPRLACVWGYTEEGIVDHSEVDAPAMCKLRAPFVFLISRMKLKVAFTGRRRDWWRRTRIRGSLFNQHGHSNRLIFDAATGSHFLPPPEGGVVVYLVTS